MIHCSLKSNLVIFSKDYFVVQFYKLVGISKSLQYLLVDFSSLPFSFKAVTGKYVTLQFTEYF